MSSQIERYLREVCVLSNEAEIIKEVVSRDYSCVVQSSAAEQIAQSVASINLVAEKQIGTKLAVIYYLTATQNQPAGREILLRNFVDFMLENKYELLEEMARFTQILTDNRRGR